MARTVEQIQRDITAIEQTTAAIAEELHSLYQKYLMDLSKTVHQQLILAAYHLCTQGYPDRFLKLSLSQRQELQQQLQTLASSTRKQLIDLLYRPGDRPPTPELDEAAQENLSEEALRLLNEIQFISSEAEPDDDQSDESSLPLTPRTLATWQSRIEENILVVLQSASHRANRLLQTSEILSNKLPGSVLEIAAKAGAGSESASNHPNLLNLLIEADNKDEDEVHITHIMAIRLRLSEIEFNDTGLTAWRNKIRSVSSQLNQAGREYQKREKEKAIAEAEAAWRSSWYEA